MAKHCPPPRPMRLRIGAQPSVPSEEIRDRIQCLNTNLGKFWAHIARSGSARRDERFLRHKDGTFTVVSSRPAHYNDVLAAIAGAGFSAVSDCPQPKAA